MGYREIRSDGFWSCEFSPDPVYFVFGSVVFFGGVLRLDEVSRTLERGLYFWGATGSKQEERRGQRGPGGEKNGNAQFQGCGYERATFLLSEYQNANLQWEGNCSDEEGVSGYNKNVSRVFPPDRILLTEHNIPHLSWGEGTLGVHPAGRRVLSWGTAGVRLSRERRNPRKVILNA